MCLIAKKRSVLAVVVICMWGAISALSQEKQKQPNAQEKLKQTCSSIKSGEITNPPSQLVSTCQALEDEQSKKEAQVKEQNQFLAGKYCGAPWAPDSPQIARVRKLIPRIGPTISRQYPGQKITYLTVSSPTVNAWTIVGKTSSLVCLPTAIVDLMSSEGELAFIMGHETGHAVDDACKGHSKQDKVLQRACESRADAVGFDLMIKSGFSAYDAGAAFGKLEMYSGDIDTGPSSRLQALSKDHPMTPDRVQHMRNMLKQYNQVIRGPLAR